MTNSLAQRLFDLDLWLAGAGHFAILFASFQVPFRLKWKQDLKLLMPFNRKLLWVQGGFTVLTILAFGALTLALHAELLSGDRAALALALFIGIYWTSQILVDAFYFPMKTGPKESNLSLGMFCSHCCFQHSRRAIWDCSRGTCGSRVCRVALAIKAQRYISILATLSPDAQGPFLQSIIRAVDDALSPHNPLRP